MRSRAEAALLTVYNQLTIPIAGQPIWVGAIAGVVVAAALLTGFRLVFATRVVAAFAALGMVGLVVVFSFPSAGGSILIPQNGPGMLWEVAPAVIAIVVLAWPQGRRSRPGKLEAPSVKGPQRS